MLEELVFILRRIIYLQPDLILRYRQMTLRVEMQNGSQRNMICGVIYRHHQGKYAEIYGFS